MTYKEKETLSEGQIVEKIIKTSNFVCLTDLLTTVPSLETEQSNTTVLQQTHQVGCTFWGSEKSAPFCVLSSLLSSIRLLLFLNETTSRH